MIELQESQKANALEQRAARKQEKAERREESDRQKEANAEARAGARAAAVIPDITLQGCGEGGVNGVYRCDGVRDGVPCYRHADGRFTIERDAAPGQATQWCLCEDYGFESWCFVDAEYADDSVPPASGWQCGEQCTGPPPTMSEASAAALAEASKALTAAEEAEEATHTAGGLRGQKQGYGGSRSHRRALGLRRFGSIKAKRRVKTKSG